MTPPPAAKPALTAILCVAALWGFAGNSLLCRAALAEGSIDPVTFTSVRLGSGALMLWLLAGRRAPRAGSWVSALCLFTYALGFSLAYVQLPAGLGALVLFGVVQCTMLGWALCRGERPTLRVWLGWFTAMGGLVWLLAPSNEASGNEAPGNGTPGALSLALMAMAGIAWGAYSLRGAGPHPPLAATAHNFVRTVPLAGAALAVVALAGEHLGCAPLHVEPHGIVLAAASGTIASGLGYAFWFAALRGMPSSRAAVVQLTVPVITAVLGIALLGEVLTTKLALAGALILGGIGLAIAARPRRSAPAPVSRRR